MSISLNIFIIGGLVTSMAGADPTQDLTLVTMESQEQLITDRRQGMWGKLVSLNEDYPHFEMQGEKTYLFGRTEECDYTISDRRVSGKHFSIRAEIDEFNKFNVVVEDLSSNGTFHNGKKLGRGKKALLYNGDEVAPLFITKKTRKSGSIAFLFKDVVVEKQTEEGGIHSVYDVKETLGTGNFSTVKLGFHRKTGKKYAIKEINKQSYEQLAWRKNSLMNEVRVMERIHHDNIVNINEVFESEDNLYIVMDYIGGGDLLNFLLKVKYLDERTARNFFTQILDGIEYLHSEEICHRDIKPENIMLTCSDKGATLKITDFGISRIISTNTVLMSTLIGTPLYLAPEVRTDVDGYTKAVDVWSLGCVLYNLLSGYNAFSEDGNITEEKLDFPHIPWDEHSDEVKDLISKMISVNPLERISIKGIRDHPWMNIQLKRKREPLVEETHEVSKRRK